MTEFERGIRYVLERTETYTKGSFAFARIASMRSTISVALAVVSLVICSASNLTRHRRRSWCE